MLINLSNHPYDNWDINQKKTAEAMFGSVIDLKFPVISPEACLFDIVELTFVYARKIDEILVLNKNGKNAIHLMGEFTFTYNLIELLRAKLIPVFASTSIRDTIEDEKGAKISKFRFVRFRAYF
jgi:hypothetical protein